MTHSNSFLSNSPTHFDTICLHFSLPIDGTEQKTLIQWRVVCKIFNRQKFVSWDYIFTFIFAVCGLNSCCNALRLLRPATVEAVTVCRRCVSHVVRCSCCFAVTSQCRYFLWKCFCFFIDRTFPDNHLCLSLSQMTTAAAQNILRFRLAIDSIEVVGSRACLRAWISAADFCCFFSFVFFAGKTLRHSHLHSHLFIDRSLFFARRRCCCRGRRRLFYTFDEMFVFCDVFHVLNEIFIAQPSTLSDFFMKRKRPKQFHLRTA